jgi:hypothetical protein
LGAEEGGGCEGCGCCAWTEPQEAEGGSRHCW